MKKNSTILFTAAVVVIIVIGVVLSIYITSARYGNSRPSIVLPNKSDESLLLPEEITQENEKIIKRVKVTPENVSELLKTLKRPSEYTFESQTVIYYGSGQKVQDAKGIVRGDTASVTLSAGGIESYSFIITNDTVHTWKSGEETVKKTARGNWNYDDLARMPTYEELLKDDAVKADSVKISTVDGEACIEMSFENADTGLRDEYVIGSHTGLLKSFKSYDGDVCVLSSTISMVDIRAVLKDEIKLPSGSTVE